MIKLTSFIIIALSLLLDMEPQKDENNQSDSKLNKGLYKYLYPAQKVSAGFFKSYQFDLRFQEIKGAPVSKNMFLGVIDYLTFKATHKTQGKRTPNCQEDFALIEKELPIVPTNFTQPLKTQIKYTWIGHATAVIQIGPDNFMIDPNFIERKKASRFRPAACKISQLPPIDVVLISHDHTDHCDIPSNQEINKRYKPTFVMGLGSEDVLPKGSKQKTMDWMEEYRINLKGGEYKITFVPTCHWARRGLTDLNTRLWGGFVVQSPLGLKFYYSGDTGYAGVFQEIGHKFGSIDLAILPIGTYEPRQFLKPQHINPEEAVKIHKQLRSRQSVGVHWGTFSMGRQGFIQPKYDLLKACEKYNLKQGQFLATKHGQPIIVQKK